MITLIMVLAIAASVMTVLTFRWREIPWQVPVGLLCLIELVRILPLGR